MLEKLFLWIFSVLYTTKVAEPIFLYCKIKYSSILLSGNNLHSFAVFFCRMEWKLFASVWHQLRIFFRGQFHQRLYAQLLRKKVLKAQKAAWFDCLFALLGSAHVKAASKMMVKLTPEEKRYQTTSIHYFSVCLLYQ